MSAGKKGRRGRIPMGDPNPVDIHVGAQVRLRRNQNSMSQEKLGDAVGLTFQQIQKYERGANRIGASRLFEFSKILDVPIAFFFDDIPEDVLVASQAATAARAVDTLGPDAFAGSGDPEVRRETMEMVQAYYQIAEPGVRKRLYELVKAMSESLQQS